MVYFFFNIYIILFFFNYFCSKSECCLSLSRMGEKDRAHTVRLFKDIKMHKEKSTQFISCEKLNTVSWNVTFPGSLVPPLCYRNELVALHVTWYHMATFLNNPNVFGRLPLPLFWLSLLQESFFCPTWLFRIWFPSTTCYHSFPFPPLLPSWFHFIFSSNLIFWPQSFVGYKFLLMVQMHCKISGRLNLCWHALCSPPWTCIKLAKARYEVPWLTQQRCSHVSLPNQHHLFCRVPCVY